MPAEHRKVLVWVFSKQGNEPLFLVLKTIASRGNFWQPVTGSVESGERVEDAALREMREETGFDPLRIQPIAAPYEFESRGRRVEEHPFLAEIAAESREQVHMDPHEHEEFQWVRGDQALEMLKYESNARVLRSALESLGK